MDKDKPNLQGATGISLSRREVLNLGLMAGAAAMIGPSPARAAGPPSKPTGQIIIGFSQEPTNFHPLMLGIEVDQGVYWNLYSPLWGVDAKGNFTPQLAAEVPTIANGGISARRPHLEGQAARWRQVA